MGILKVDIVGDTNVVSKEIVEFSLMDKAKYIESFNNLVLNNVIIYSKFEDNEWKVITGTTLKTIVFNFDKEIYDEENKKRKFGFSYENFILAIKSFILLKLSTNGSYSVSSFMQLFKSLMKDTKYLSYELLETYRVKKTKQIDYNLIQIKNFFLYLGYIDIDDEYFSIFEYKYEEAKHIIDDSKRELPSFESMFLFNDIMDVFIKHATDEEKEEFFPIILWWKITTVIPLRATEFTVIPYDCEIKNNNEYYLRIYRSRLKKRKKKDEFKMHNFEACYKPYIIGINKEIYNLIQEYKSIVDKYDFIDGIYDGEGISKRRDFLLSSRSYYKCMKNKAQFKIKKGDKDIFGYKSLEYLKNKYLKNIIIDKYNINVVDVQDSISLGNEINMTSLMDTRHFAIINMVMMGYEPAIIMEMAGHNNINTSYRYFNYMKQFMKSYTISKMKKIMYENKINTNCYNDEMLNLNESSLLSTSINSRYYNIINKKNNTFKNHHKVLDDGVCTYVKNDFIPCYKVKGNHSKCIYFHPNINTNKDNLKREAEKIEERMNSDIDTLQYIISKNKEILNFTEKYHQILNNINICINDLAHIKVKYVEGEL